jgi:hypothetical protein
MGVRTPSVRVKFTGVINGLTAAVENIVMTLPPLNLPFDGADVYLFFYVSVQAATGTNFTNFKIRRGATTAGALVNTGGGFNTSAGLIAQNTVVYVDSPGNVAEQQYILTLTPDIISSGSFNVVDYQALAFVL